MSSSKVENNFYRFTSVGISLLDSLDELVGEGKITPQLAMKVMQHVSLGGDDFQCPLRPTVGPPMELVLTVSVRHDRS